MVKLYALYINDLPDPLMHPNILTVLPSDRQEKILRYRHAHSRRQSLGAGLLLNKVLSFYGKKTEDITYNLYGKPEISGIHFNLSHSEDLVICAVSEKPVGCDVEKIKECHEDIAERFFTKEEMSFLKKYHGEEKREAFYRIWTLKESYVKMVGEGVHLPFDQFEIILNKDMEKKETVAIRDNKVCDCCFKEFSIPGYKMAVCAKESKFVSAIDYINGEV